MLLGMKRIKARKVINLEAKKRDELIETLPELKVLLELSKAIESVKQNDRGVIIKFKPNTIISSTGNIGIMSEKENIIIKSGKFIHLNPKHLNNSIKKTCLSFAKFMIPKLKIKKAKE